MAYNATVDSPMSVADLSLIVNFNKITGELMTKEIAGTESELDGEAFLGLYKVACRERTLEKEYKDSKKS